MTGNLEVMPSPRAIRELSTEQKKTYKSHAEEIGDRAGRRWAEGWPISGRCVATVGCIGEDSKEYDKNVYFVEMYVQIAVITSCC